MVSCHLICAFEKSSLINDKALFKVKGASPQAHMQRVAISVPLVLVTHPRAWKLCSQNSCCHQEGSTQRQQWAGPWLCCDFKQWHSPIMESSPGLFVGAECLFPACFPPQVGSTLPTNSMFPCPTPCPCPHSCELVSCFPCAMAIFSHL